MSLILKKSAGIALATSLSRILGFVRVILVANFIGGGIYMAAWVMAFKIPNMFRRLLGEGALGTALIPYITHILELEGEEVARKQFSVIIISLGIILAAICAIIAIGSILINSIFFQQLSGINIALKILPILIPFAFFICLVGVSAAILNSRGVFFIPALGSLLLNLSFITCLLIFGPLFIDNTLKLLYALSICVLLSGFLHLALSFYLLKKEGFAPDFSISIIKHIKTLKEILSLSLPGLIGAGCFQISLIFDTAIAYFIGGDAISALEYSERLVYLPIGVIAVSIGSVSLVQMSKNAAKKQYNQLINIMIQCLEHLAIFTIPILFFICSFRYEIIETLFSRGAFAKGILLNETAYTIFFYALGIPAFASLKIIVTAFYSRKNMKTPFKVSIFCLILNLILNLILMYPLRQGGVALATTLSSFINCAILIFLLKKEFVFSLKPVYILYIKTIFISLFASFSTLYISNNYLIDFSKYIKLIIISITFAILLIIFSTIIIRKEIKKLPFCGGSY